MPVLQPRPGAPAPPSAPSRSEGCCHSRVWAVFRVARCREGQSWAAGQAFSLTLGQIPSLPGVRGPLLSPPGHSPDPKMSARPLLACPLPRLSPQCRGPAPNTVARAHPAMAPTTYPVRPLNRLAYNFKLSRFSKTTTTDGLRRGRSALG